MDTNVINELQNGLNAAYINGFCGSKSGVQASICVE